MPPVQNRLALYGESTAFRCALNRYYFLVNISPRYSLLTACDITYLSEDVDIHSSDANLDVRHCGCFLSEYRFNTFLKLFVLEHVQNGVDTAIQVVCNETDREHCSVRLEIARTHSTPQHQQVSRCYGNHEHHWNDGQQLEDVFSSANHLWLWVCSGRGRTRYFVHCSPHLDIAIGDDAERNDKLQEDGIPMIRLAARLTGIPSWHRPFSARETGNMIMQVLMKPKIHTKTQVTSTLVGVRESLWRIGCTISK